VSRRLRSIPVEILYRGDGAASMRKATHIWGLCLYQQQLLTTDQLTLMFFSSKRRAQESRFGSGKSRRRTGCSTKRAPTTSPRSATSGASSSADSAVRTGVRTEGLRRRTPPPRETRNRRRPPARLDLPRPAARDQIDLRGVGRSRQAATRIRAAARAHRRRNHTRRTIPRALLRGRRTGQALTRALRRARRSPPSPTRRPARPGDRTHPRNANTSPPISQPSPTRSNSPSPTASRARPRRFSGC
jgi:hypothetical protein